MELQEAIKQHDIGAITTEQFTEIVKENQQKGIFWIPKGKNQSRFGFLHHYVFSSKGRFFQDALKKHILGAINRAYTSGLSDNDLRYLHTAVTTIHFSWRTIYDRDAFIYSDPRLNALETHLKGYIESNIPDIYPYNHDFLFKIIDISLGLAKEDSYYRARLVDFVDKFRKNYPDKTIYLYIPTLEKFTRDYIHLNFQNAFPYKHNFMNALVDIILQNTKDNSVICDFVDDYRKTFPEMLLAPGEIDNINRWH